ncbi:hypothetical protein CXG45_22785 [Pseudomonas plecoglossicida]|uniref:Diguanylate cyclase n=1 Tax=Pseudomonas plecoglossicida TaxID=70775 RepID=A0ABX4TWM5_PSEDL|nr:hypothetical protein CXG44_18260 [Pseudomonas plecoglossicida]PLU90517.1 hypothetical protein CXG45_22785 [Pseudomonas plecoglossicida]PLV00104.1 hypothetical protein CXG48_22800 [Pseudomonas plecoglossicida]PLV11677.1 hypothetical protein CXG47_21405 [Pseudomonas plecoglossicida]
MAPGVRARPARRIACCFRPYVCFGPLIPALRYTTCLKANTGAAGAIHRVACFAGEPAPTGTPPAEGMRHTCGSGLVLRRGRY